MCDCWQTPIHGPPSTWGHAGSPPLVLQVKQARVSSRIPPKEQLKWVGIAAGLLLLAFLIPYGEALLLKPHVAHVLAESKKEQGRLAGEVEKLCE